MIFTILLALCVAGLGGYVVTANKDLEKSDQWVEHTHEVIIETQELQTLIQRMLASQRGYLLSGDEEFLKEYQSVRTEVSDHVANMRNLTADNPSQESRIKEFQHYFLQFSDLLESRMQEFKDTIPTSGFVRTNKVSELRTSIADTTQSILETEYGNLNSRVKVLTGKTDQYLLTLLIGGGIVAVLLVLLNAYLLKAQSGRTIAEQNLKEAEERLRLAIRGTNDGIYDWNIADEEIYLSPQYKAMLGYDDDEFPDSIDEIKARIHPEDSEGLWEYVHQYFNQELSEFSYVFRMKHKSGRWVWVNTRGKAIYDENGKAARLIGAHTDVTYLKENERQLEEAKLLAENANAAKSDFLAHMSHEIRTPLTAVSGVAEILLRESADFTDEQKKLVKVLSTSSVGLKDLINDILDFSKVDSGQLELSERAFSLGELIEAVVSICSVKASEKQLDFKCNFEDIRDQQFFGDDGRLRQILVNLIGNAIKFTEKGFVHVSATRESRNGDIEVLRIDVEDSGIGIEGDSMDLIFEKFKQGDSSIARRFGGTGLGLPISRNLAHLMGGEIEVKSEPGKGSTFTVLLPFKDVGFVENQTDEKQLSKLNDRLKAALSGEKRILLVEDFEGNIVVLGYLLDSLGCKFDVARTGLEALNLWKENHYDLILMDIQMPEMDGLTAASHIRKMEQEQGAEYTPIIGMTAHALASDKQRCLEAGMDDYQPKPIVEIDLKNKILQYLKEEQPDQEDQAA